jgi:hypothetical protein
MAEKEKLKRIAHHQSVIILVAVCAHFLSGVLVGYSDVVRISEALKE